MKIVDATEKIATRHGVPAQCVVEFAKALERIFADGERGLDTNCKVSASVKRRNPCWGMVFRCLKK